MQCLKLLMLKCLTGAISNECSENLSDDEYHGVWYGYLLVMFFNVSLLLSSQKDLNVQILKSNKSICTKS